VGAEFGGEVATYYSRYRRGYDLSVIEWLANAFALDFEATVVDLGCGTGQLAIPISARVRAVVGVDPEPQMLSYARAQARDQGLRNVCWLLGSDADLDELGSLLGAHSVALMVIGNAIHLMDHGSLFNAARSLIQPGGGLALLANSTPLWRQASAGSRALRAALEDWFETSLTSMCGTDQESRRRYAAALTAAGYRDVRETVLCEYTDDLGLEWVIGHLYSAIPEDELPASDLREAFEHHIRDALGPSAAITEHVKVTALTAVSP
jgi:SAM-dependent methyltransferase